VGQFLARYEPAVLAQGLRSVVVQHAPPLAAEARVTIGWLRRRLAACGANEKTLRFSAEPAESGSLAIRFDYADEQKFFQWRGDFATKHAILEADFGTGRASLPAGACLLAPEMALSEAMFF
jgi:hypothetical protein